MLPSNPTKWCPTCSQTLSIGSFSKNCTKRDGRQDNCKECRKLIQKQRRLTPGGYAVLLEDYKKDKNRRLMRNFGLTQDQYDALFASQGFRCAMCDAAEPGSANGWHLDHDHSTGVVRGILCHGCNNGIGQLKDDPKRLAYGIHYLHRHGHAFPTEELLVLLELSQSKDWK